MAASFGVSLIPHSVATYIVSRAFK